MLEQGPGSQIYAPGIMFVASKAELLMKNNAEIGGGKKWGSVE